MKIHLPMESFGGARNCRVLECPVLAYCHADVVPMNGTRGTPDAVHDRTSAVVQYDPYS